MGMIQLSGRCYRTCGIIVSWGLELCKRCSMKLAVY